MLVLTRKAGEKIRIGNDIVLSVLEVDGGTVKMGIDAPRDVDILRMEVFEKIQRENIEAASRPFEEISEALDIVKKKLPKE
ncbi:MAG: carbon storage regulator CsrA [Desulfobacteraceae bacterium]